jgi:hypothetical protein
MFNGARKMRLIEDNQVIYKQRRLCRNSETAVAAQLSRLEGTGPEDDRKHTKNEGNETTRRPPRYPGRQLSCTRFWEDNRK